MLKCQVHISNFARCLDNSGRPFLSDLPVKCLYIRGVQGRCGIILKAKVILSGSMPAPFSLNRYQGINTTKYSWWFNANVL